MITFSPTHGSIGTFHSRIFDRKDDHLPVEQILDLLLHLQPFQFLQHWRPDSLNAIVC